MKTKGHSPQTQSRIPRVAHVIDSLDISGGAEHQLVANLRSFDLGAIEHHVVLMRKTGASCIDDIPDSVRVHWLKDNNRARSRLGYARELARLTREQDFDLIHATLPDSALASRLAGLTTRTPVVESLVNISHEQIRTVDNPKVTRSKLAMHTWLDRLTTRRVRRFHAVSKAVAHSWTRIVGIDSSLIDVIPRGIDRKQFGTSVEERAHNRLSVIQEFDLPVDTFLIVAVGRQEPQKGHRYLLEAADRVKDEVPTLQIMIVGRRGLATKSLEAKIAELGLEDTVRMIGPRRDVARLVAAGDLFAFPSLFEGNGGNALIEAMSIGATVLASEVAPITELIPDQCCGVLVPRTDSAALAAAISRLASDPELRKQLGQRARERAQAFPTPEEVARMYEDWYRVLLRLDGPSL